MLCIREGYQRGKLGMYHISNNYVQNTYELNKIFLQLVKCDSYKSLRSVDEFIIVVLLTQYKQQTHRLQKMLINEEEKEVYTT